MLAAAGAAAAARCTRAVSAGEHLPRATWEAFHDATGVAIIDGIGATEMLHIFICASGDAIRPGSTGAPCPATTRRCSTTTAARSPPGTPGRLAVKGPTGCRYLDDPRQPVYVQDGWNITGDTFRRDADGYFWYEARSDDMIISSGYNIAAPEVEEAVLRHPDVAECGVVGVPDEDARHARQGVRRAADGRPTRRRLAELQDFVKRRSRRTSTRGRSSSSTRSPARRPASCSASGCGTAVSEAAPRQLIATLYGLYARAEQRLALGGSLVRLMEDLGVDAAAVRSSVSRLKKRDVLALGASTTGAPATRCPRRRVEVLRRATTGSGRGRGRPSTDGWLVVVFSVPESEREKRHALRSQLTRLGFGSAAPGVWIAPGHVVRREWCAPGPAGAHGVHRVLPGRLPRRRRRRHPDGAVVGPRRDGRAVRRVRRRLHRPLRDSGPRTAEAFRRTCRC